MWGSCCGEKKGVASGSDTPNTTRDLGNKSRQRGWALMIRKRCLNHSLQANKQTSWAARPRYVQQSKKVCHQANFVILRMVSIPERTKLFRTNLKNKLGSLHGQLSLHPQTHLSHMAWETAVFANPFQAICSNAVIFLILTLYCIIWATNVLLVEGESKSGSLPVLSPETKIKLTKEEGNRK